MSETMWFSHSFCRAEEGYLGVDSHGCRCCAPCGPSSPTEAGAPYFQSAVKADRTTRKGLLRQTRALTCISSPSLGGKEALLNWGNRPAASKFAQCGSICLGG